MSKHPPLTFLILHSYIQWRNYSFEPG